MSRRPFIGTCHICGVHGKLSFEHVPPKKAFNNQRIIQVGFNEAFTLGPYDTLEKGPIQQGGAGAYTLCPACNNTTGSWYADAFVRWCRQGATVLIMTGFNPRIFTLQYIFPLRVLKQIATMFFSVNSERFASANPELVEFVLNKNRSYLPPKYRFYVYFNRGSATDKLRYNGFAAKLRSDTGEMTFLSEISFPPFGYVFTIDSEIPDRRLFEITHFSRYRYNGFKVLEMKPVVLDTPTFVPGDYRKPEEVVREAAQSEAEARSEGLGSHGSEPGEDDA